MPRVFHAPTWSVELPDDWTAEPQAGHVELKLPFAGAELRITPYHDKTGKLSAVEWLQVAEHFTRKRGRPVIPRRCGAFVGHETHFDADGIWIRGWALLADGRGLDVDYRCATADAGRDDHAVNAVLSTLQFQGPAT